MDVYSVIYDPTEEIQSLDGANVLAAPNMSAIARLTSSERVTEFREFNLPFYYFKDLDQDKLLNNEYKLTIVFTSSKDGAYFEGAEGSTLIIDEVELICDIDDDK